MLAGEARVILNRFGVGDLTAKGHALNHQSLKLLARGEECCRQTGGAGADDDHIEVSIRGHHT